MMDVNYVSEYIERVHHTPNITTKTAPDNSVDTVRASRSMMICRWLNLKKLKIDGSSHQRLRRL
jgi:hypothetical protein